MNKNMSRREFVATAGLFAGMMGLVGCGGSGSAATTAAASSAAADAGLGLVTDGKLTVGTSPDFPPFENLENDQYVGLDIDLAQALCSLTPSSRLLPLVARLTSASLASRSIRTARSRSTSPIPTTSMTSPSSP